MLSVTYRYERILFNEFKNTSVYIKKDKKSCIYTCLNYHEMFINIFSVVL